MKNLKLTTLDVQEMSASEMKKHNGGFPQLLAILLVAFAGSLLGSAAGMGGTAWYLSKKTYRQY